MVDEEDRVPEGAPEDAPAEQTEGDKPEITIERLASEEGWVPKEQFTGNPERWRPAHEYLKVGKSAAKNMSREIKRLSEIVENTSRVSQALLDQQLSDRDAYWENKWNEAVEAGDHEATRAAEKQRELLKESVPPPPQSGPPPEAEEFKKRNSWFGQDPLATKRAIEIAQAYTDAGHPPAAQVAAVEKRMRVEFPELFGPPQKNAPRVQEQIGRNTNTDKKGKGFADLPEAARKAALDFEERRNIPRDEYAKLYWKREDERKVA